MLQNSGLMNQKRKLEADLSLLTGEVDEAMQESRSAVRMGVQKEKEERKAKYIGSIMQAHKHREIENEKVFERKMQKEADAEAHLYGDKEKFMTGAYRRKLEAREEYEADLKRKEAEEARDDVTKRDGLGHFYSNLLDGNLAPDATGDPRHPNKPAARSEGAAGSGTADEVGAGATPPLDEAAEEEEAAPSGGLVAASLADSIAQAVTTSAPTTEAAAAPAASATVTHERRNDGEAVMSARDRYLARKRQRTEGSGEGAE